ncbi:MAG: glycosyltransferase family 4 protein [Acidobacteriota bacterium]|nr:glycosyltransferase family 4 protein [Blastocatellia bacterium]MDW8238658.1 glycosyltransferase family 4 protein [Acidobacteriota bacterium]
MIRDRRLSKNSGMFNSTRHEPIKVLIVCTVDHSVQKLLAPQIRALEQAGYRVDAACGPGPVVQSLRQDGFQIHTVEAINRVHPLVNLKTVLALYRLMRRERYEIVHVHTLSAAFVGRLAAWLAGVPLILYTFRGFAFYAGAPWYIKPLNLLIEWLCRPMTDFFFSQSEENRQRAIRYGVIDPARSLTIGNGIRLADFITSPADSAAIGAAVRQEWGIPASAIVVGMVGRLVKEKGVVELIEAAEHIRRVRRDVVFLMVGEALHSDIGMREQLRQMIERRGLTDHFVFTGFRHDVARFYHAMDICVLPSYREGMPRSIMEAMACGKPVVASDIAGCRDEVVHGQTGWLVPVKDAAALGDALLKLINDPALAQRMGQAGQQRARELFDEERISERIVETYHHLIEKKLGLRYQPLNRSTRSQSVAGEKAG